MAIHMFTGRPGQGKTYILVRTGLKYLAEGYNVYANFWIDWKGKNLHSWNSIGDLIHVQKGIILMDEAQIYFNARRWERLPEAWQYKLQQHRKDGLTIFGTVQNIKRVDSVMRELVSNYYECKKFFNWIIVREFDIKDADKIKRRSFSSRWYSLDPSIYKRYDTLQKIGEHAAGEADATGGSVGPPSRMT